jgi:hypothetical protein
MKHWTGNEPLLGLVRRVTRLGEFLAQWVIVYFGQLFENYKSSPQFWATLFHT